MSRNENDLPVGQRAKLAEEPVAYRATKGGVVFISWNGKTVTTLKGKPSETFLTRIADANAGDAQLLMAKATGHFKHGTEPPSGPDRG
jgi:hypothetical protein